MKVIDTVAQIEPRMKLRVFYGDNNLSNGVIHIRAIVDKDYYVVRKWSQRKGWIYKVEHYLFFKLLFREKALVFVGYDKD